jgi:hypothetical protein
MTDMTTTNKLNGFLSKKPEVVRTWQSAWANHTEYKYAVRLNPAVSFDEAEAALSAKLYKSSHYGGCGFTEGMTKLEVDAKGVGFAHTETYEGIGD